MPSLFSNFLNCPSLISPHLPPLSPLRFNLEHWHPRLPLSLCLTWEEAGGGGGLSLPPAPAIARNFSSVVPLAFFHVYRPHLHPHSTVFPNYLVAPWFFRWLHSGFILHLWSFCVPHYGHSCVECGHHYQSPFISFQWSHCSCLEFFYTNVTHKTKHYMISSGVNKETL